MDKGKSTNTVSREFPTFEAKVEFLKRYFKPKHTYKNLDYRIVYHDNSTGSIPGPSDWDIAIVAMVPKAELDNWVVGLKQLTQTPNTQWLTKIPTVIDTSNISEWYQLGIRSVVGIDRKSNIVVYRNVTN